MALPKINHTPKYTFTIPSTQQPARFRPFLVKEQKVLLIAMESQDPQQIIGAIADTVANCAEDPINVGQLTPFDIEYLFTQIRSKSVGEKSNVNVKCSSCEEFNPVEVNLSEIKVVDSNPKTDIKISDEITVRMKLPTYAETATTEFKSGNTAEALYSGIIMCMDKLLTEEELIDLKEESYKEKEEFLDSLNNEQFTAILEFVNNGPRMEYDVDFTCKSCGTANHKKLSGLNDFF